MARTARPRRAAPPRSSAAPPRGRPPARGRTHWSAPPQRRAARAMARASPQPHECPSKSPGSAPAAAVPRRRARLTTPLDNRPARAPAGRANHTPARDRARASLAAHRAPAPGRTQPSRPWHRPSSSWPRRPRSWPPGWPDNILPRGRKIPPPPACRPCRPRHGPPRARPPDPWAGWQACASRPPARRRGRPAPGLQRWANIVPPPDWPKRQALRGQSRRGSRGHGD